MTSGHVHVARLDIQDYFPSFEFEKLVPELPLQKELVEHVVVGRHHKVLVDEETKGKAKGQGCALPGHPTWTPLDLPHPHDDLLTKARRGLPQGSACSPIVGMYCMSRLAWNSMPGVMLVNYADDFLLLAMSPELLAEAVEKLMEAVEELPGGQFKLKLKATSDIFKGFNFLGHHIRLIEKQLVTMPSRPTSTACSNGYCASKMRFPSRCMHWGSMAASTRPWPLKPLARMKAILDGWLSAFKECDEPARKITPLTRAIEEWLHVLDLTPDEVQAATDPGMGYRPSDYALGH